MQPEGEGVEEVVADKGYHSDKTLVALDEIGVRSYVSDSYAMVLSAGLREVDFGTAIVVPCKSRDLVEEVRCLWKADAGRRIGELGMRRANIRYFWHVVSLAGAGRHRLRFGQHDGVLDRGGAGSTLTAEQTRWSWDEPRLFVTIRCSCRG